MRSASPLVRADAPTAFGPVTGPILVALGGADVSGVLQAAEPFESTSVGGMLAVAVLESQPPYLSGEYPSHLPPEFEQERETERHAGLRRAIVGAPHSAEWETKVVYGDPAFALTALAAARRSPLIVMGIGRRRPIDRLMGTETAARVIRRAHCPVLAVTHAASVPFHEAVVAMDFSVASISAAIAVIPLMATSSVLRLVHVWDRSMVEDAQTEIQNARYSDSLSSRFLRLRDLLAAPAGVTVEHEIRVGRVAEHLFAIADTHHADVIVAGRQGLSALERLFVGSVTTTILHGASCSVLVAPEPPAAERDRILRRMSDTIGCAVAAEWAPLLDAFTRRNRGRRTTVEVDDVALGAQIVESGYALQGATYDPHDRCVELMLGDGSTRHLTRTIADVSSIAIYTDQGGRDAALRVGHGPGQTLVTFLT